MGSQSKTPEAQNASEFGVLLNHSTRAVSDIRTEFPTGQNIHQAHSENIKGNVNDCISQKHIYDGKEVRNTL